MEWQAILEKLRPILSRHLGIPVDDIQIHSLVNLEMDPEVSMAIYNAIVEEFDLALPDDPRGFINAKRVSDLMIYIRAGLETPTML